MSAKVKSLVLVFCLSSLLGLASTPNELQMGLQIAQENSYRDTAGPFLNFFYHPLSFLNVTFGSGLFLSNKELESLTYSAEIELAPLSWLSFSIRGSQRAQLSDTFSTTNLLSLVRLKVFPENRVSIFASGGGYHRWGLIERSSLVPFLHSASFTQNDFATELGIKVNLSNAVENRLRLATFDLWDVYNLNNPFLEASFLIGEKGQSGKWLASFRYQLLLGFGRLDRLVLGLFYLTTLN